MRIWLHVMRNSGSFLMNRLGFHISLFQLFVISTTHFSSPALQSVFYVLWNPRSSHIHGRERVKAEIIVTLRKSLNLAGPLYSGSCCCRSALGLDLQLHCAPGSGHTDCTLAWKCFIYDFHNGGLQGGLRRVMGRWIRFLVSSLGRQTELRRQGGERACNQFCSLCSLPWGTCFEKLLRFAGAAQSGWAQATILVAGLLISKPLNSFFLSNLIFSFWRKISWMLALFALFTS